MQFNDSTSNVQPGQGSVTRKEVQGMDPRMRQCQCEKRAVGDWNQFHACPIRKLATRTQPELGVHEESLTMVNCCTEGNLRTLIFLN